SMGGQIARVEFAARDEGAGEVCWNAIDVKLAGGEGNDDSLRHEAALNFGAETMANVADETWVGDKRIKGEKEGGVAEAFEGGGRSGVQQDAGILTGDREEEGDDAIRVSSVGDAHFDGDAKDLVFQRPVDEVAGDEFAIGDDHALIVAVDNRRCAN